MTLAEIQEPVATSTKPRCTEHVFTTWDGIELVYHHWAPEKPTSRTLLLFHRGHEHSGRWESIVRELGCEDLNVFAWDARGHGRSPGERGYADHFSDVVRDMAAFLHHLSRRHDVQEEETIVLGHSVGAVAVAAWVHDYAPRIRAMILATPAFRVKLYIPFALPALRIRQKAGGRSFIKSYVRPGMLTHDPAMAADYASDPLISRQIATNILLDLHDTSTRLLKDAGAITTPTLLLSAGSDWVVKNSAQRTFFERLGSDVKRMDEYTGFYHSILHEKERDRPLRDVRRFINEQFAEAPRRASLIEADRAGYTRDEYERLSRPLPRLCPGRLNFAIQKIGMKSICRLSKGISIGWRTGFDSGQSLDYIYRNESRGFTPLGRFIDRIYLNTVGWRGIRQRKADLQQALRRAIDEMRESRQPVRIVDIAAGGGRYLLEVLREFPRDNVAALLRDRSAEALNVARATASEMKLENVGFEGGDAFNADDLANLQPRPNIAIVSGLYELFEDNALIRRSLSGLAGAIEPGGVLIYTNQPWHPQIEMIARVLANRDGKPWIMRRRTQAEMDELVRAAGFEKEQMTIDPAGIFTVSLARRRAE